MIVDSIPRCNLQFRQNDYSGGSAVPLSGATMN